MLLYIHSLPRNFSSIVLKWEFKNWVLKFGAQYLDFRNKEPDLELSGSIDGFVYARFCSFQIFDYNDFMFKCCSLKLF